MRWAPLSPEKRAWGWGDLHGRLQMLLGLVVMRATFSDASWLAIGHHGWKLWVAVAALVLATGAIYLRKRP